MDLSERAVMSETPSPKYQRSVRSLVDLRGFEPRCSVLLLQKTTRLFCFCLFAFEYKQTNSSLAHQVFILKELENLVSPSPPSGFCRCGAWLLPCTRTPRLALPIRQVQAHLRRQTALRHRR